MQFLFKIQIYNENNNTCTSHSISTLEYGPSADIGVSGRHGMW